MKHSAESEPLCRPPRRKAEGKKPLRGSPCSPRLEAKPRAQAQSTCGIPLARQCEKQAWAGKSLAPRKRGPALESTAQMEREATPRMLAHSSPALPPSAPASVQLEWTAGTPAHAQDTSGVPTPTPASQPSSLGGPTREVRAGTQGTVPFSPSPKHPTASGAVEEPDAEGTRERLDF